LFLVVPFSLSFNFKSVSPSLSLSPFLSLRHKKLFTFFFDCCSQRSCYELIQLFLLVASIHNVGTWNTVDYSIFSFFFFFLFWFLF
jgi:hypothetical protein